MIDLCNLIMALAVLVIPLFMAYLFVGGSDLTRLLHPHKRRDKKTADPQSNQE